MKTINKLLFLFCFFPVFANAQSHKVRITAQGGWMNGGAISNNELKAAAVRNVNGLNVGGEVSWFFTNRFFAGVHYNYGNMSYLSNTLDSKSETNYRDIEGEGTMDIMNIGLIAGYYQPLSQSVNVTGQIGFAHFVQMDRYPRVEYIPDENSSSGFRENFDPPTSFNFFSMSIPVKFSMGVMPFRTMNAGLMKNLEVAYALGWYIEPDFGFFTCWYHGPQLSLSF